MSEHEVMDIFFLNPAHGWVAVNDHHSKTGQLYSTSNGGESWVRREAPDGIVRLFCLNGSRGWALKSVDPSGKGRPVFYLLRTENGGKTWTRLSSSPVAGAGAESMLYDLAFINPEHGWLVGSGPPGHGLVLETLNGGKSFHAVSAAASPIKTCYQIVAVSSTALWIYGDGGLVQSTDEGRTWQSGIAPEQYGTTSDALTLTTGAFESDGRRGWVVGQDPEGVIFATSDGHRWRRVLNTDQVGNFKGVSFWNEESGCASSFYPTDLFCTNDGGQNWQRLSSLPVAAGNEAKFFNKLVLLPSGRGWIVRGGGFLYETRDEGRTWREIDPTHLGSGVHHDQK